MLWLGVFGHVFARDRSDTTRAVDFCSAECARNSSRKEGSGLSAALCYLASAIFSMLSWPRTICSFYKSRVPLLHYLLIRTLSNSTALHWPRFIAYHAVRVYCALSILYCSVFKNGPLLSAACVLPASVLWSHMPYIIHKVHFAV